MLIKRTPELAGIKNVFIVLSHEDISFRVWVLLSVGLEDWVSFFSDFMVSRGSSVATILRVKDFVIGEDKCLGFAL